MQGGVSSTAVAVFQVVFGAFFVVRKVFGVFTSLPTTATAVLRASARASQNAIRDRARYEAPNLQEEMWVLTSWITALKPVKVKPPMIFAWLACHSLLVCAQLNVYFRVRALPRWASLCYTVTGNTNRKSQIICSVRSRYFYWPLHY